MSHTHLQMISTIRKMLYILPLHFAGVPTRCRKWHHVISVTSILNILGFAEGMHPDCSSSFLTSFWGYYQAPDLPSTSRVIGRWRWMVYTSSLVLIRVAGGLRADDSSSPAMYSYAKHPIAWRDLQNLTSVLPRSYWHRAEQVFSLINCIRCCTMRGGFLSDIYIYMFY